MLASFLKFYNYYNSIQATLDTKKYQSDKKFILVYSSNFFFLNR